MPEFQEQEDQEDEDNYNYDDDFNDCAASWGVAAYRAVEAGVPLFLQLARDPDPRLREMAVYALAWFPLRASLSTPIVRHAAQNEADPVLRANALLSLAMLDRAQGAEGDAPFFDSLLAGTPTLVRFAASMALGLTQRPLFPPKALVTLLTVLEDISAIKDGEPTLLWNNGSLWDFASEVLKRINNNKANKEHIVDALGAMLSPVPPQHLLTRARLLFEIALGRGWSFRALPALPLRPLENRALQIIAQHGVWWIGETYFDDFEKLIDEYGLPSSEESFKEFVRVLPA